MQAKPFAFEAAAVGTAFPEFLPLPDTPIVTYRQFEDIVEARDSEVRPEGKGWFEIPDLAQINSKNEAQVKERQAKDDDVPAARATHGQERITKTLRAAPCRDNGVHAILNASTILKNIGTRNLCGDIATQLTEQQLEMMGEAGVETCFDLPMDESAEVFTTSNGLAVHAYSTGHPYVAILKKAPQISDAESESDSESEISDSETGIEHQPAPTLAPIQGMHAREREMVLAGATAFVELLKDDESDRDYKTVSRCLGQILHKLVATA